MIRGTHQLSGLKNMVGMMGWYFGTHKLLGPERQGIVRFTEIWPELTNFRLRRDMAGRIRDCHKLPDLKKYSLKDFWLASAIIFTLITWFSYPVKKTAHSVRSDPSSSPPTCPVFLVLAHVVPALAEHWLLIFPTSWEAGPSFAPFSQADPISLKSQATTCAHVGHTSVMI
jgi:hypothetical protein